MRIKLLTFRYSATLGGFDDTPLVDFTRDKEVIAFREHFYLVNEVPHLSCVVHYQDAVVPQLALDAAREIPSRPQQQQPRFQRRDGAPDPHSVPRGEPVLKPSAHRLGCAPWSLERRGS